MVGFRPFSKLNIAVFFIGIVSIFLLAKWVNLNKGYEPATYLDRQIEEGGFESKKTILLYTAKDGDRENWKWNFPKKILKCKNNVVCRITSDHERITEAEAVVVSLSDVNSFTWTWLPVNYVPPQWQKWVATWGEAPWFYYHMTFRNIGSFSVLNGIFDWTISYRPDSTIISNYLHDENKGDDCKYVKKSIPSKLDYNAIMSKKSDLALWVVSHCSTTSRREDYIEEMNEYMHVTTLGSCSSLGRDDRAFNTIDWYKFYLSFENSLCDDYITEKFFNILKHNTVPVALGAPKKDYEKIAPPNSFIHADDFDTPEDLAKYLKYLDNNQEEYLKYLEWKKSYELVCEEKWPCQLCAKLYKNEKKTRKYDDFPGFWNKSKCYGDWHYKTNTFQ